MPKRYTREDKYIDKDYEAVVFGAPDMVKIAMKIPKIVDSMDTSIIKMHQLKPDWSLYRFELRDGIPYIVREMCDRCGKVKIPPRWRKRRVYHDEDFGDIFFESGICKDCINAGLYVDKYLDGVALTEKESKELFYKYAEDYEKAWRIVIAAAPREAMTEPEWERRCKFFNGCAVCGGPIEVRAKYFPSYLNGAHTAWNVIPMCGNCLHKHYAGRVSKDKTVYRYRVFSSMLFFNKSKTIRMYLLHQMKLHKIYMEPLLPFMERFKETKILDEEE